METSHSITLYFTLHQCATLQPRDYWPVFSLQYTQKMRITERDILLCHKLQENAL
jgi:hypothetical protein